MSAQQEEEEVNHPRFCGVCLEVHLPAVSGIPCSTCKKFVCEDTLIRVHRTCPHCRGELAIFVNMVDAMPPPPPPIVADPYPDDSDDSDGYMSDIIEMAPPHLVARNVCPLEDYIEDGILWRAGNPFGVRINELGEEIEDESESEEESESESETEDEGPPVQVCVEPRSRRRRRIRRRLE